MTTSSYPCRARESTPRPPHPNDGIDTVAAELLDRLRMAERRGRLDQVRYFEARLNALGARVAFIPAVVGAEVGQ